MEMNTHPLVSILIPVYGVEKYIERCARSVFEQTYENLEYIFVDDCTPDKSIQVLEKVLAEYPKREKQTRIIHHVKNRGIAATRNTAVESCSGDFLTHVDSDDWLECNAVELLVNKQIETGSDIVTANAYEYYGNEEKPCSNGGFDMDRETALETMLSLKMNHSLWGRLIKTSLYKNNHICCEEGVNFAEDFQILPLLFYYASKVSGISHYIYHYNKENIGSYTTHFENNWESQRQSMRTCELVCSFFSSNNQKYKKILDRAVIKHIHHILIIASLNKNRVGFDSCKKSLMNYREAWSEIHWNCYLWRLLESNMTFLRMINPIRLLRIHIIQYLHKIKELV